MGKDRKVKINPVEYENSDVFCNLILQGEVKVSERTKKANTTLVGFTLGEAKQVFVKLGEALHKHKLKSGDLE